MPAPLLKMLSFFLMYNFSFFVKNQVFIGVWVNIRVFNSIPLAYLSIFVPIPISFQDYGTIIELEVRDGDVPRRSFIVQSCFGYPGFMFFHIKLSIVLSRSVKNCVGILMGIALTLWITLGNIAIFYYVDSTYPRAWEIFPYSGI